MRMIFTDCSIEYKGRCETFLPIAKRLVVIKDDGSVIIHVDSGIKPLNYMKASKELRFAVIDGKQVLRAINSKEELLITMYSIERDEYVDFPDSERKMVKKGTEDLLQKAIADNFEALIPNAEFVCREFETGKGPVDVLGQSHKDESLCLVEVKRHAHRKDVYQILRYGVAIDDFVSYASQQGITAIEAKERGDNDEKGKMIPISYLANRKLYLASRKFARGTIEEAKEHNIGIIDVSELTDDSGWNKDNLE